MALNHFFTINFPYGIIRNRDDEWMAFNREYMPLGFSNEDYSESMGGTPFSGWTPYDNLPVYTTYKNLSEKLLIQLALNEQKIYRDEKDLIYKVFFYDDMTNPVNVTSKAKQMKLFQEYFDRITPLLRIKSEFHT
jgi:hypothetical protein